MGVAEFRARAGDPALRADLGDRIERTWPWAGAFVLAWQRRTDLPALT
ncbi:hypothetical protein OIE67_53180 [Nonomuraea fuscirosea]|nr:hypothetical protein [Nonomuraea fuscirosea]WSA52676.1 hypothetical protein OIE67_53180 [Nonomuraea fuscirosea]